MSSNLTVHLVDVIPWSNLNRDDTGLPKRTRQGGVERGLLSSQAIKRAARVDYELKSGDISVRSANLADAVADRVSELSPEADSAKTLKAARALIGQLTKESSGDAEPDESGRSAWLSAEEIEAAAHAILTNVSDPPIREGRTGALAIAAFGRMFANKANFKTEAAVSVSPAVSTHAARIETDYFSTVDDSPSEKQGAGATFLGVASYVNGVFYRTVTIDRAQLHRSWTGITRPDASQNIEALITSLIYKLPRGKSHGTAPYTMPALVLIEEQAYRVAYEFETPVQATDGGGYLAATIQRLRAEREAALRFDPDNFGPTAAIAGTATGLDSFNVEVTTRLGIAERVTQWILA